MPFLKEEMQFGHYDWIGNGSLVFTGAPSRRVFDRFNGNQVLFLINSYGSLFAHIDTLEARKLEAKLFKELPTDTKSEISVFNWLKGL